jgi:hypothetical protein
MQRSMDDRVVDQSGKIVVIGSEIPPIRVMTIELRYFEEDQRSHDIAYWGLIGDLHKSKDDGIPDEFSPQGGRQSMRILRTLALAAFNPLRVGLPWYCETGKGNEQLYREISQWTRSWV